MMNAIGSSDRIFQLFDRASTIPNVGGDRLVGEGGRASVLRGVLQFKDVSFSYPTRRDVLVLDRVSLTVQPGSVVALCRPSSSGKSSIVQLALRFYDPQDGVVLVDGVPLQLLDASWWRQAALVAQEPVLFGSSVSENITYGCSAELPMGAIEGAARTANAHEFILDFPDGYDTLVGERGAAVGRAEAAHRDRARAARRPKDPTARRGHQRARRRERARSAGGDRAADAQPDDHPGRPSPLDVRDADMICVVSKGRIVERGAHDELVALDGVYTHLVARQMGGKGAADSRGMSRNSSAHDAGAFESPAAAPAATMQ